MHIVAANEMYEMDRWTMEHAGIPGITLMESAGRSATEHIKRHIQKSDRIVVLIGTGNNGGDGFVIARTLLSQGYQVHTWLIAPEEKVKGDALAHKNIFLQSGYVHHTLEHDGEALLFQQIERSNVLIDAMLGIGLKGPIRSPYKEVIATCNQSDGRRIAIDVPSGLDADGRSIPDMAFRADVTVTLHLPKLGAFSKSGAAYYGELEVADIGIPPLAYDSVVKVPRNSWTKHDVQASFPERRKFSHKGTHGRGIVIGGSSSMTGAPVLASRAALRSGAGLITTAVPDCIHPIVSGHLVESTFSLWPSVDGAFSGDIPVTLDDYDAVMIGPGMGRMKAGERLLTRLVDTVKGPLIIDADGLYHLGAVMERLKTRDEPTVLTPHMGEMARLTGMNTDDLERNRFDIARDFAMEYGVHLILKGPYTLITDPYGKQTINTTGNASLAKGGSGDVLSGIIMAFVMQHENLRDALCNAVHVHGSTADLLVGQSHSLIDVLAMDVIEALPSVYRSLS